MNFQDQRLFETEIIKENVVFKVSSRACPAPVCHLLKYTINLEMLGVRG